MPRDCARTATKNLEGRKYHGSVNTQKNYFMKKGCAKTVMKNLEKVKKTHGIVSMPNHKTMQKACVKNAMVKNN
jgi:hypothetical protein